MTRASAGPGWGRSPVSRRTSSSPALPVGQEGSLFLRIFSSASGIDPYAAAVSDVYQDLFGEGTYTGKGIYDVDAFERATSESMPENRILSHDLIEGAHVGVDPVR